MRLQIISSTGLKFSIGLLAACFTWGCATEHNTGNHSVGGGCMCSCCPHDDDSESAPTTESAVELNTHLFETGHLQLSKVSDQSLGWFLRDLNRRKDYAIACRDGGASDESEYLWLWLTRVCDEFRRRGYNFDNQGNLYQGDRAIALR